MKFPILTILPLNIRENIQYLYLKFYTPQLLISQEIFEAEHASNVTMTWLLRGAGWLMMFIGFIMMTSIITTLGKL